MRSLHLVCLCACLGVVEGCAAGCEAPVVPTVRPEGTCTGTPGVQAWVPEPVDAGPEPLGCTAPPLADAPGVLCDDTWCFEHPQVGPTSGSAVFSLGADDVWFGLLRVTDGVVQDAPLVNMPVQGGAWENPAASMMQDVWAADGDSAWGILMTRQVVRFSNGAWSVDEARTCKNEPRALWGFSDDDVWLVGSDGTDGFRGYDDADVIAHWDGTTWTSLDVPAGFTFFGVHGSAPDDVWFAGAARVRAADAGVPSDNPDATALVGALAHWDGAALALHVRTDLTPLVAVVAPARGVMIAAGAAARPAQPGDEPGPAPLVVLDDGACVVAQAPCTLRALDGTDANTVWGVCDDGDVVERLEGEAWRRFDDVGARALSVRDGVVWTDVGRFINGALEPLPVTRGPVTVHSLVLGDAPAGSGFAVVDDADGARALLARDDTGRWSPVALDEALALSDVAVGADGSVVALGLDGVAVHDGADWRALVTPFPFGQVDDLCVNAATDAWAADRNRGVAHFDGSTWTQMLGERAIQVFCLGDGEVLARSWSEDALWVFEDGAWRAAVVPTVKDRSAAVSAEFSPQIAFARTADDLWSVDGHRYDGAEWTRTLDTPLRPLIVNTAVIGADGETYAVSRTQGANGAPLHRVRRFNPASDSYSTVLELPQELGDPLKMFASPSGALLVVLWNQSVLRVQDGAWTVVAEPPGLSLGEVWLADEATGFAWDRGGARMMRFTGASYVEDLGFPAVAAVPPLVGVPEVADIFGFGPADVWAAHGGEAAASHWDGVTWTKEALPDPQDGEGLLWVFGVSSNDVWAGGTQDTLWRTTGDGFVRMDEGFASRGAAHQTAVGARADDVWFLSDLLWPMHWDGTTLEVRVPAPILLVDAVRGDDDVISVIAADGVFWERPRGGAFAPTDDVLPLHTLAGAQNLKQPLVRTGPRAGRGIVFHGDGGESLLQFSKAGADFTLDVRPLSRPRSFPGWPLTALSADTVLLGGPGILRFGE